MIPRWVPSVCLSVLVHALAWVDTPAAHETTSRQSVYIAIASATQAGRPGPGTKPAAGPSSSAPQKRRRSPKARKTTPPPASRTARAEQIVAVTLDHGIPSSDDPSSPFPSSSGSLEPLAGKETDAGSGGGEIPRRPLRKLSGEEPRYPTMARRRGVEGMVKVRFVVDLAGHVETAAVVNARPAGVFENAALAAVLTWRFEPTRALTPTDGEVDVVFRLQ